MRCFVAQDVLFKTHGPTSAQVADSNEQQRREEEQRRTARIAAVGSGLRTRDERDSGRRLELVRVGWRIR